MPVAKWSEQTIEAIIESDDKLMGLVDGANSQITISTLKTFLEAAFAEVGVATLKETTTPVAATNYGKIYTKVDNKLYFQDGTGTEHEISLV